MMHSRLVPLEAETPRFQSEFLRVIESCIDAGLLSGKDRVIAAPATLPSAVAAEGGHATEAIVRLIHALPERLFEGSPRLMGRACGFSEAELDVMTRGATGKPSLLARSDAYLTAHGWKFTEFNIGSSIGGYQIDWAYRVLDQGPFEPYTIRPGRIDTSLAWCEMVGKEARAACGRDRPVIAIADTRDHLERFAEWNAGMARELRENAALQAFSCCVDELRVDEGGVFAGAERVDMIYRLFSLGALMGGPDACRTLHRASLDGKVKMIAPMDSRIYSNKAVFALLSDPANRHRFSREELDLIDRHIPATRLLGEDSLEFARAHRTRLVAKPVDGQGGQGVIFGADHGQAQWEATLRSLMATPHVLQEQIFPSHGSHLVWSKPLGFARGQFNHLYGIFTVDSKFAGINLRATPVNASKVLQYSADSYTAPVYPARS